MYNHILYLLYWLGTTIILLVFGYYFEPNVVLGNYRFNSVESAIYAGFWATVIFWSMWDYVYVRKVKLENNHGKFWVFWAFNTISLWLVSRFPHLAGFGISSFVWAFIIGLAVNFVQKFVWRWVVGSGSGGKLY